MASLPDWILEGIRTKELYEWLNYGGELVGWFSNQPFAKAMIGSLLLIYGSGNDAETDFIQYHTLRLCGIFRITDRCLYEVSPILYQVFGIPEEFCFPDKEDLQDELEEKVTYLGRQMLLQERERLMAESGFQVKQFLPRIDKQQIRLAAKRYVQMGKHSGDIAYEPRFRFEEPGGFSDALMLQYLDNETNTVRKTAENWLKKSIAAIIQKQIYYGCIREELSEMEAAAAHKKRAA